MWIGFGLSGLPIQEFYAEKRSLWSLELQEVEAQIAALRRAEDRYYDVGLKFLELAQKLYNYWHLQQDRGQRGEVVKALLSNCVIKDGTLCPTYRKPFDLIVEGLQTEEWLCYAVALSARLRSSASSLRRGIRASKLHRESGCSEEDGSVFRRV